MGYLVRLVASLRSSVAELLGGRRGGAAGEYDEDVLLLLVASVVVAAVTLWHRRSVRRAVARSGGDAGHVSDSADHDAPSHDEGEELQHVPFEHMRYDASEMVKRSREFYEEMNGRRSLRFFSDEPVPLEVVENIVRTAGTAPSGAHTEPWTFVVVSSPDMKRKVRELVEAEERLNYERRMSEQWKEDLAPLKTTWEKPYLETAPHLVVAFKQSYGRNPDGSKKV